MSDSSPDLSTYTVALAQPKPQGRTARFTAQRRVNTEVFRFYWGIGATILQRQDDEGWVSNEGALPAELRVHAGVRSNLAGRADSAAGCCTTPLEHITVLLDRLDDHELCDWYAGQAAAQGLVAERSRASDPV